MLVTVKEFKLTVKDIQPGQLVTRKGLSDTKVSKLVEDYRGRRVIFEDGTWRPFSTYGVTWQVI